MEVGEGVEADMERDEGGRAEAEPVRGREKILCYINMQSPGRSSDLDLELHLVAVSLDLKRRSLY